MKSRRFFLKTSVMSLALFASGCIRLPPIEVTGLPSVAIDIHTHIFNGLDVPAVGFISQVFLRNPGAPVEPDTVEGLILLLKNILLSGTLTAEQEYARIGGPEVVLSLDPVGALVRQDKRRVRNAIARFEETVEPWRHGAAGTPSQKMLQILYSMIGNDDRIVNGPVSSQSHAEEISDFIYGLSGRDIATQEDAFRSLDLATLIYTLRWAGMLTRNRVDILSELKRLYGGEGKINVFCPSFLDMELWLAANEGPLGVSTVRGQINVMAKIAKQEKDVVLLNFVGFCPLRAALATRDGKDPLELIEYAILDNGFAGVKIYPPIGFQPFDNLKSSYGYKHDRKASGEQLDAELERLYHWCAEHDVPIKTHGNNSMGADVCSGENAGPAFWAGVNDRPGMADLRIDIAHFGGFEQLAPRDCPEPTSDWEDDAAALAATNQNIYLDIGFWNEMMPFDPDHLELEKMGNLLADYPTAKNSIMYGSDWSMIARLPNHNNYLHDVAEALEELELDSDKIMRENALRFLGLDRPGQQSARLSKFFGTEHKFNDLFSPILRAPIP